MIEQVFDNLPQGFNCGQPDSIPHDNARYRRPGDEPDCSSQTAQSSAVPVVVLVEHRDDVFDRLTNCFTAAGFRVARATSAAEAIKRYVSEHADLLVINANRPAESAWLLAAKLRLTHPAARIWAYVFQPSTLDVAAANLLATEELIEYDGKVAELESQLLERLGMPANSMPVNSMPVNGMPVNKPASCPGSSARIDPTITAAYALT